MKLIKSDDKELINSDERLNYKIKKDGQVCPRCNGSGKTELLRTIPTSAEVIIDVYGKLYLKCSVCNKNEI